MKTIGIVLLSIGLAVSLSGCFGSGFPEGRRYVSSEEARLKARWLAYGEP
jgi:hypothetical protein